MADRYCPYCGCDYVPENEDECPECGFRVPLDDLCPYCGGEVYPSDGDFCPTCGKQLSKYLESLTAEENGTADPVDNSIPDGFKRCPDCNALLPMRFGMCPFCEHEF